jgi:hypothetical protein
MFMVQLRVTKVCGNCNIHIMNTCLSQGDDVAFWSRWYEWGIVVQLQVSNFAATSISWWEQVIFQLYDEDDVCSALDQHVQLILQC